MENINGDASTSVGMESTDGSSAAVDQPSLVDPLKFADTCIERAEDRLRYGRRQEAEEALVFLKQARFALEAARTAY